MAESRAIPVLVTADDVRLLLAEPQRAVLAAQPIVDLPRGVVVGYELLARFALGRPSPPDHVFATAMQAGLAEELEALVVSRAMQLFDTLPSDCFLTVNVDPLHLTSPLVREVIDRRSDLHRLVFELTEHRAVDDIPSLRRAIQELHARGAMFAVDDAGSGYSGLKQILELRPQLIKLDRELVSGLHRDEAKRALVQMLGQLAARLDAGVIAEGIEGDDELRTLCNLGVPLGQGYFLGRPSPPWTELSEPAQHTLRDARAARPRETSMSRLVEPCATLTRETPWPEDLGLILRVDDGRRPLGMRIQDHHGVRVRAEHELMRIQSGTTLSDIALRVVARPDALRWDPAICVDDRGLVMGILRPQRLLAALAEAEMNPPANDNEPCVEVA